MNRIHVGWSVVVALVVALVAGCGSGENPNVQPLTNNRLTSRASGTITSVGLAQNLSMTNSYAVAVQDPTAFSDQWTLYVIFGMRSFNPLAVPQGVLAIFLDQVDPNIPTSIEVPAGQVKAALHTNFQNLPVAQLAGTSRTVMNVSTGGYFILEAERSRASSSPDTTPLQVRLHDFALSTITAGTGVVMQAQIPYSLTRIPTPSFLLYVRQLGVDQPPSSTGGGGGGGTFPPSPPSGGSGGSSSGDSSFPPSPPSY